MSSRSNLSLMPVDHDPSIREVLGALVDSPRLASALPKLSNALIAAEQRGYCSAECLARFTNASPSIWQWSITPLGKQWLQGPRPKPERACRSKRQNNYKAGRIGELAELHRDNVV